MDFISDASGAISQKDDAAGNAAVARPQKRFYRSRAHCNPLAYNNSFTYPVNPLAAEDIWKSLYPNLPAQDRVVRHLDIGMGFGGLTIALAEIFPDKLVLGMEIRAKVMEYLFTIHNFQYSTCFD